jgi:hypothetical protein
MDDLPDGGIAFVEDHPDGCAVLVEDVAAGTLRTDKILPILLRRPPSEPCITKTIVVRRVVNGRLVAGSEVA